MKNNNLLITIVVALTVGAVAFFGGMQYQKTQPSSGFSRQLGNGQGLRNGGFSQNNINRTGFRPVNGEILTNDDNSITVKLQDGSSKIVILSDETEINKATKANKEDLKEGEKVAVFGKENSDGSVIGQNIQINPIIRSFVTGQPER